jgi:BolA protein
MDREAAIRERLTTELQPSRLAIINESHKHVGHASAGGAGHFAVQIVSEKFEGIGLVARHRLIYAALGDLMGPEIHALSIDAKTAAEI